MTETDPVASTVLEQIRELVSKRDEALAWVARASADDGELDAAAGAFEVVQDKLAARAARLVAAVEAALKPHQPGPVTILGALCKRHEAHRHFSITSTEAADVQACQDCAAAVFTSCAGCSPHVSVDACPVREAVTAALTGKEAGDER